MPAPDLDPPLRNEAETAPTNSYQPTAPIWVFRHGAWRAGIIETASPIAATVTYRPSDSAGTCVDTVTARYLTTRTDPDPLLDPVAQPDSLNRIHSKPSSPPLPKRIHHSHPA